MKICFVSKEVAGVRGGGIGTYIAEAGKALRRFGHEVWLLTEDPGADRRHLLDTLPGFTKVIVNGHGIRDDERMWCFHGEPHLNYSRWVHQTLMKLAADGQRFDYVEFADYEAEGVIPLQEHRHFRAYGDTVLGLMLHSPTHECFQYDQQGHRTSLYIRETCNLEDHAIRIAPLRHSPSKGLRDEVLQRLGLPTTDTAIIRYPMELPERAPTPTPARQRLTDLSFLYYGRIEPRKGIEQLMEAFAQLPELSIEMIGGDVPYSPYGKSYRDWCKKRAPANVTFVDAVPRPELLRRVATVDVCIFPSLFENWPNTCIEAMAAGRVVLGSRHGGMSEMIEHGKSGFLVDGREANDIARVIRKDLAAALSRLPAIGAAASERIRAFSDQKVYERAIVERVETFRRTARPLPIVDAEKHKVSVVVPFYKDSETIDETIDSAIAQQHRNLEILIVDDGSPLPDAEAILARQAAKDPRVRVLRKKNGGLSSARNHGIEHAKGEYLLFLDADNLARPDYARIGVEVLERHRDAVFVAPYCQHFDHATRNCIGVYNPLPWDRAAGLLINRFGDAGAFFRRSLFLDHELRYDETLISYEDWALWMDLQKLGLRGELVPRVLYDYRVRRDSMVSQDGRPNHPALMGLLVQRHFPALGQEEREALVTLFQVAGPRFASVSSFPQEHTEPPPNAHATPAASQSCAPFAPPRPPLRHKVVDEMARVARKVPGLSPTLRWCAERTFALGRKLKGR